MKELKLRNSNKVALVDNDDFDRLSKLSFWIMGSKGKCVGRVLREKKYLPTGEFIKVVQRYESLANAVFQTTGILYDHIDRNFLNNQRENLRVATYSTNRCNSSNYKFKSSKYKGVSWNSEMNKWVSCIQFNGIQYHLGSFKRESDAAIAYNNKAIELHKEFAALNIVS